MTGARRPKKIRQTPLGLWHLHRELNGLKAIIWCFNRKYNALVFITCLFPLNTSLNLQARLLEDSWPRTKVSTLRKYTFPYIEIEWFSAKWTYKSCSIEQIYHYFQLSSPARYFQAGRRKEVEDEDSAITPPWFQDSFKSGFWSSV